MKTMSANNGVRWVRLGELIDLCDERNSQGLYGEDYVMGMTITKEIIPTKADVKGADLRKYLVVNPEEFVYNPRTHGKKIGLGYNRTNKPFLISWNNIAFKVKNKNELEPNYLYMYLCREEWDRNACYCSWGTSTEVFSWAELCLMSFPLPSIEVQRELVNVYSGLKSLAEENKALLSPLSEACQAFIVDCKDKYKSVKLGELIVIDERANFEGTNFEFLGVNKDKIFMPTNANTEGLDPKKYLIISKGKFVFSGMQTGRDVCIRVALYSNDIPGLVSPAYSTFRVKDKTMLIPEYLMIHFKRAETDRLGWFKSDSSIRSNLDWERFCELEIPLPPLEVQQKVVDLFNCYEEAKRIVEETREQMKMLCPALIQKATHTIKA